MRRELLTEGGFTALTRMPAAVIARPDPALAEVTPTTRGDAELTALADRFMALHHDVVEIDAYRLIVDDDTMDAITNAQAALLAAMDEHTATTVAGHRARARVLVAWFKIRPDGLAGEQLDSYRVWALLRDLTGEEV